MRRTLILGMFLCGSAFAGVCEEVNLREHLVFMPEDVKVLSKREVNSLCEIILQRRGPAFSVYATKDFVIAGEMISKGMSISRESIEKAQAEVVKKIIPKLREYSATAYGEGKKEIFFVSDPDCPYCQGIKKKVKELADKKGYKIYLIWFPLPIHQKAKEKAVSFVCEKRDYNSYINDSYGRSVCSEGLKKVEGSLTLLEDVVNATPTFIFPDGRVMVGGNPKALEEAME